MCGLIPCFATSLMTLCGLRRQRGPASLIVATLAAYWMSTTRVEHIITEQYSPRWISLWRTKYLRPHRTVHSSTAQAIVDASGPLWLGCGCSQRSKQSVADASLSP